MISNLQQLENNLKVRHTTTRVSGGGVSEEAEDGVHISSDDIQGLFQSFTLFVNVLSEMKIDDKTVSGRDRI